MIWYDLELVSMSESCLIQINFHFFKLIFWSDVFKYEWMNCNNHLEKISVVHSDRTNRSCLNPSLFSLSPHVYFQENKKGWKPRVKSVTLWLWWVIQPMKLWNKHPACAALAKRGGEKAREGAKSGLGRLEPMKWYEMKRGLRSFFFWFRVGKLASSSSV